MSSGESNPGTAF